MGVYIKGVGKEELIDILRYENVFDAAKLQLANADRKTEPQTESLEQFRVGLEYHTDTIHFGKVKGESITTNKVEDEPQTDCAWK